MQTGMDTKLLLEAGLTEGEVKVYLALLQLGDTTTGPLIKKARVSASKCYDILERLIQKGLVSTAIKANTKHFSAADPKRILDYVREKEQGLAEKRQQLADIVPELRLQRALAQHLPSATVFEGYKGMKTAMQHVLDTLHKGDVLLTMGAYGGVPLSFYRPFFKKFHDTRAAKGIKAKMVFNWRVKETIGKDREETPLTEVKYMPPSVITPATIQIFHDYVVISLLTDHPLVVMIQNKSIADSFREYFNMLWNQENRTLQGFDGIRALCDEVIQTGKDLYLIGANGALYNKRQAFFFEFDERRLAKGIVRHHLAIEATRNSPINQQPHTHVRYLPKEFNSPMVIWVFGDKVANILWDDEVIYLTENKKVAEDYKKYFALLWKMAKP